MLTETVKDTIDKYRMLDKQDRVLVGFSGGYDSLCLALVLMELGYQTGILYVNHQIRPGAEEEVRNAAGFARDHGIRCYLRSADVPAMARKQGLSLEDAGRRIRYQFFEEVREKEGFSKIAVAHNQNDNSETVLLHLIRGSGLNGLCGIPAVRGHIVRPLLFVGRRQIEEYVDGLGIRPAVDETNAQLHYTRNKIRHLLLPVMEELNPSLHQVLGRMTAALQQDRDCLAGLAQALMQNQKGRGRIARSALLKAPPAVAARALMLAYEAASGTSKDFDKVQVDAILQAVGQKEHGNVMDLDHGVCCRLEYGVLLFEKKSLAVQDYCYELKLGGATEIKEAGMTFYTEILPPEKYRPGGHNTVFFDYDGIKGPIVLRNRREGDRFIPFGMEGTKRLKRFFIDEKITEEWRRVCPLLVSDRILWVCGLRRSADYPVTEQTKTILKIRGEKTDVQ